MRSISIIGLGRAGGALAMALTRAGFEIDQLIYRGKPPQLPGLKSKRFTSWDELRSIRSEILLIATQDQQIKAVAEHVSSLADRPKIALHLSGSLSSAELESLQSSNVATGSMHPLVSLSNAEIGATRFSKAYFCIEGDPKAVDAAQSLIGPLGGRTFTIESGLKPLYHASAVMASGHVTALLDLAIETLSKCGLEPELAKSILFPLIKSTVANLNGQKPSEALTGPFVRGDTKAICGHIEALERGVDVNGRAIYLDLGERSIRIAQRDSADTNALDKLTEVISMAKRKTGC